MIQMECGNFFILESLSEIFIGLRILIANDVTWLEQGFVFCLICQTRSCPFCYFWEIRFLIGSKDQNRFFLNYQLNWFSVDFCWRLFLKKEGKGWFVAAVQLNWSGWNHWIWLELKVDYLFDWSKKFLSGGLSVLRQ